MFFLSSLFFVMKFDRLIFMLMGIEFFFFCLLVYYAFYFESLLFFYFVCFGVISGVSGLVMFFFSLKSFGCDKVLF